MNVEITETNSSLRPYFSDISRLAYTCYICWHYSLRQLTIDSLDFKSYKNSHVINVRLNFVFGCFRVPVIGKLSLLVVNHGPQKLQALDVQVLLWAVCYCTSLPHYFSGYSARTSIGYVWFFAISQHLPSFFLLMRCWFHSSKQDLKKRALVEEKC